MNKLFTCLIAVIVVLSSVSGFLFYQLDDVNGLNSELRSQNVEVQNQLNELQTQNSELDNQVAELQNQNSEQQKQIDNQLEENSELRNQIGEEQAENDKLENQTTTLQVQLGEVQDQLEASQNQTILLQNQVSEQLDALRHVTYELALERPLDVLISGFKWDWSFSPMVGLSVLFPFNVTVSNIDATALGGLTLNVRLLKKGTLIEAKASSGFSVQIGNIQARETQEIPCRVLATFGTVSPDSAVCAIRLTVNGIVLDERTYNLPQP